jgi:hypothetical protein
MRGGHWKKSTNDREENIGGVSVRISELGGTLHDI